MNELYTQDLNKVYHVSTKGWFLVQRFKSTYEKGSKLSTNLFSLLLSQSSCDFIQKTSAS